MKQLNHSPEAAAHLLGLTLRETEERFARLSRHRYIHRGPAARTTVITPTQQPVTHSPL